MGAKNTKPAAAVPFPSPPPPAGFNVVVTRDGRELETVEGAVTVEDQIRRSYDAGKQEGLDTIHRSLDSVAAQVYDNVHEQLVGMQGTQLTKVAEMVRGSFSLMILSCLISARVGIIDVAFLSTDCRSCFNRATITLYHFTLLP